MDGPVEQPSHTHDQTLILLSPYCQDHKAPRHHFFPSAVELMVFFSPTGRDMINTLECVRLLWYPN